MGVVGWGGEGGALGSGVGWVVLGRGVCGVGVWGGGGSKLGIWGRAVCVCGDCVTHNE